MHFKVLLGKSLHSSKGISHGFSHFDCKRLCCGIGLAFIVNYAFDITLDEVLTKLHCKSRWGMRLCSGSDSLNRGVTKIEAGIIRSCHKRPVSSEQISSLVDQIENALFSREDREISSSVIGEMVMEKLKDLDPVAYVRFASVYREFKDVDTFMQELTKLLEHQERRKR